MKKLILIASIATLLAAQQTRREEVVPAPNPADDLKSSDPKVPDAYAMSGRFDRVVILRFKFGVDLLATFEKMVKQEKIRNAVILSAMGSVRGYQVHQVSNRDFPSKNVFVKDPTAPADLISMNGFIIDGRIHAHVTLASPDNAFGGHLEPGTSVFTFAVIALGVLNPGVDLSRVDDKNYR
jgi:predicted DNA-binding protein with PD1-like motif